MAAPALSGVSGFGTYATTGGTGQHAQVSLTTTATRGLVAIGVSQASGTHTISDNRGNTWVQIGTNIATTQDIYSVTMTAWLCTSNSTGGAGHIVSVDGPSGCSPSIWAGELDMAVALDANSNTTETGASPYDASLSTVAAETLVLAGIMPWVNTGWAVSASGYTTVGSFGDPAAVWPIGVLRKSLSSAATESPSMAVSGNVGGTNVPIKMLSLKATAGGSGVSCDLSVTDASDSLSSAAVVAVTATLARTDAADALSASASVQVVAALGASDTADSLSATAVVGSTPVTCTLAVSDAADTLAANAAAAVVASLTAADAGDSLSAAAQAAVAAALAVSDAADTLAGVMVTGGPITASLAVTDDADSLVAGLQTSNGAADYEEKKRRQRRILEQLAQQVLEDEQEEAKADLSVLPKEPAHPKPKAKILRKVVETDDEDEIEAMLLLM